MRGWWLFKAEEGPGDALSISEASHHLIEGTLLACVGLGGEEEGEGGEGEELFVPREV